MKKLEEKDNTVEAYIAGLRFIYVHDYRKLIFDVEANKDDIVISEFETVSRVYQISKPKMLIRSDEINDLIEIIHELLSITESIPASKKISYNGTEYHLTRTEKRIYICQRKEHDTVSVIAADIDSIKGLVGAMELSFPMVVDLNLR